MANFNYTITDITFSTRQVVVNDSYDDKGNAIGNSVRTTKLVMHASYKFKGLTLSDEYGVVTADLLDLTVVTISPEGLLTSIKCEYEDRPDNLKTPEGIVAEAKKLIEARIASDAINAAERNYVNKALSELKSIEVPEESSVSLNDIIEELSTL